MKSGNRFKLKLLIWLDKVSQRSLRKLEIFRSNLLGSLIVLLTSPSEKARLQSEIYSNELSYRPEGAYFQRGLFDWEQKITECFSVSPRRILLIGCGAGREILGLREYYPKAKIVAIDACYDLLKCGREYFSSMEEIEWIHCSIQEFLAGEKCKTIPFDLIWFGWGTFSHLVDPNDTKAFFNYVSHFQTSAQIVVTYVKTDNKCSVVRYYSNAGFLRLYQPTYLEGMLRQQGLGIEVHETTPYPHILLTHTPTQA